MYGMEVYTELPRGAPCSFRDRKTIWTAYLPPFVRTGLVVLGAVIAVLGGGLIVTLGFLSVGPATTSQLTVQGLIVSSQSNQSELISPSTAVAASIGLSWTATTPANVSLTPAGPCLDSAGICPDGPPVLNWTGVSSGKGTDSNINSSAYILEVVNGGLVDLKFSAVITLSFQSKSPLPAWGWGLIAGGGLVLLAIGGIAIFLGLFLPKGVYQEGSADPPVRRTFDAPPEVPEDESAEYPP